MAEWLRHLTRKPKVRTAVGSNPTLDSLVAVRNSSPDRPELCGENLVALAGSCGGLLVKHLWPLLEISLFDFRGLATLNIDTYLPTYNIQASDGSLESYAAKVKVQQVQEHSVNLEVMGQLHLPIQLQMCSSLGIHISNG